MATAQDLIKYKRDSLILSISPDDSVFEAVEIMASHNVGAVLVTDSDKVQGILTERDILIKVNAKSLDATKVKVREVMTGRVLYVESSQSLEECMELMISKSIRHLPIYNKGILVGLISIRDVLREVISEQKTMISHLENYISGL